MYLITLYYTSYVKFKLYLFERPHFGDLNKTNSFDIIFCFDKISIIIILVTFTPAAQMNNKLLLLDYRRKNNSTNSYEGARHDMV